VRLGSRALLVGAAACAVAFVVLLALAYLSAEARAVDGAALEGFVGLQRPAVDRITGLLQSFGDPVPVVLVAAVLAGVAAAQRRPRVALLVLALVAITSVSSQLLKALLAYPRSEAELAGAGVADAAFPSGHATAAMSLAIALVVAMPARLRPAAALAGLLITLGVSYSVVVQGGHFPSDIVGGHLLATGVALVLLSGLRAAEARYPEAARGSAPSDVVRRIVEGASAIGLMAALATAALGIAAVGVVVLAFRTSDLVGYAQAHTAFGAVAVVLALSAITLLCGLAVAAGRRG